VDCLGRQFVQRRALVTVNGIVNAGRSARAERPVDRSRGRVRVEIAAYRRRGSRPHLPACGRDVA